MDTGIRGSRPGLPFLLDRLLSEVKKKKILKEGKDSDELKKSLLKAVEFAWYFMHPDGSYGGEYGSRNTFHFYPHGFELMAPESKQAGQIADAFLNGITQGKRYRNDDDRMTTHYAYDFLQAWEDRIPERPLSIKDCRLNPETIWLKNCGLIISRNGKENQDCGGRYVVANLNKGGVVKVFDEQGPIASDTGIIGELTDGTVVVSHLVQNENKIDGKIDDMLSAKWSVQGFLCKRRKNLMSVFKNLLLRFWCLTIGRFNANLTRSIVQKIAITGKPKTQYLFERSIELLPDKVCVTDYLDPSIPFNRLSVGSDATSIYVANSLTYQESRLCPLATC